jgi:hypothetical protein
MLSTISKIDGLLAGITKADIEQMPPAHRQRLAVALRYIAEIADPSPIGVTTMPKTGILNDLNNGVRAE